jgi:hypothetical protein
LEYYQALKQAYADALVGKYLASPSNYYHPSQKYNQSLFMQRSLIVNFI